MTLDEYLSHYIVGKEIIMFLLIALGGLIVALTFILLSARIIAGSMSPGRKRIFFYNKSKDLVERFFEMVFSGTSILSFLATYYLIDRFVTEGSFRLFWDKHSDMLLLILIILSCVINTCLDRVLVPLKNIDSEQKASVRMIGMLYIILIFVYIKFIYENNNYDGFITYFLGLMVGRFAYFDSSFTDFVKSVRLAAKNLPLLILGLCYTGFMCYIGFSSRYLLVSNGVLVSTFIAHIFMVVAIAIVYHSRILKLLIRDPKASKKKRQAKNGTEDADYEEYYDEDDEYEHDSYNDEEYDDYEDYSEYDNDEY